MSDLVVNMQVVKEGIALLPTVLRKSEDPRSIKSLLTVLLERQQRMEIVWNDLFQMLWDVDRAYGVYLDRLGAIVGQPREGRQDPAYRLWIKARRMVNQSNGSLDDLEKVVKQLDGSVSVTFREDPHCITMVLTGLTVSHLDLYKILRIAKAAGVTFDVLYSTVPMTETFRFGVGPGFGSGHLAGLDSIR